MLNRRPYRSDNVTVANVPKPASCTATKSTFIRSLVAMKVTAVLRLIASSTLGVFNWKIGRLGVRQALQLQDASLQTSSHCACGGNR